MMRIIICEDAHKLLDDFIYHALSSWSSGQLADVMGYSEAALLYRAAFLDEAMKEAEAIYNPQWKQLSFEDYF